MEKCGAIKRERDKPGYDPVRVARNNEIRENWNEGHDRYDFDEDPGDSMYWDSKDF